MFLTTLPNCSFALRTSYLRTLGYLFPSSYKSRSISLHYPLTFIFNHGCCCSIILVVRLLPMACLHVVIQIDGFQSGEGEFHIKALGMAHPRTHTCQLRRCDTTELLSHSAAAIFTYRYQARQHGWKINSRGLPSTTAGNCLLAFIQDSILDTAEAGFLPTSRIVLWAKGTNQCHITTSLLSELPDIALGLTLTVRNLEDLECPPARQLTDLQPDRRPTTMAKLLAMSEWLMRRDLI